MRFNNKKTESKLICPACNKVMEKVDVNTSINFCLECNVCWIIDVEETATTAFGNITANEVL